VSIRHTSSWDIADDLTFAAHRERRACFDAKKSLKFSSAAVDDT